MQANHLDRRMQNVRFAYFVVSLRGRRFGVLGAGVIPDSLTTLRLTEIAFSEQNVTVVEEEKGQGAKEGLAGAPLSRGLILEILHESVMVRGLVQPTYPFAIRGGRGGASLCPQVAAPCGKGRS